jgi:prepilin-type N-terminal cleavage/methylation domain-containing protein
MLLKRNTFLINHEDIVSSCKINGFSLIELLFALFLLSFGLTALVKTHSMAAQTLKNAHERYHALLIAQEFMDDALVTKKLTPLSDKIYRDHVWYFVSKRMQSYSVDQAQVTINVKWRQYALKLSARISPH